MKKRIKLIFIVVFVLICSMQITSVYALTVSKKDLTIDSGKSASVKLYANTDASVSKIDFTLVYTTYDIAANFIVDSKFVDNINGIHHSISLDKEKTGEIFLGTINIEVKKNPKDLNGIINIHTVSAKSGDNIINLNNQVINVKVNNLTSTDNLKKDNSELLLEKIDSKLTKIDILDGVFEYSATINGDVEELDLVPTAKNKDSKIDISSQKISELKDNKIIITVTNDDKKQEYIINIKKKEEKKIIDIDESQYVSDNDYKKKWSIILLGTIIILSISFLFMKKR